MGLGLGALSRALLFVRADAAAFGFAARVVLAFGPAVVRFMFGIVDNISRVASRYDIVAVFRKGYTFLVPR